MFAIYSGKLANRLVAAFCSLIVLQIIVLISLSYYKMTNYLYDSYVESSKKDLSHVSGNLDNYIAQLDTLSLTLRKDDKFMNILLFHDFDNYSSLSYLESQLENMFYSRSDLEGLSFYIPYGNRLFSISRKRTSLTASTSGEIGKEDWLRVTANDERFRNIEPADSLGTSGFFDVKNQLFFYFHRALVNIPMKEPFALITYAVNSGKRNELLRDVIVQGNEEKFYVLDKQDRLFYSNAPDFANVRNELIKGMSRQPAGFFRITQNNHKYLAIYDTDPEAFFHLVKVVPESVLNQTAEAVRNLGLAVGGAFVLILIVLTVIISNKITKPLKKLSRYMGELGDANFDVYVSPKGNDEIARLSRKFNLMVSKIKELIEEEYQAKLNQKQAQMRALEAQINPHYLYNALQGIAAKALTQYQAEEISQMIEALALSLRYVIKDSNVVSVDKELLFVEHYILLQKGRFGEKLALSIDIDESVRLAHVPKLSIQTLVENSVKHGLERTGKPISIAITGYINNQLLVLSIRDNGPGIPEEQLLRLLENLDGNHWGNAEIEGMGLNSVFQRLKLLIHSEAALTIRSSLFEGTEVRLIIPLK